MFGDKKSKVNSNNNDSFSANTIQNGTILEGKVESEGNIRIDGKLDGTLSTNGKLVVGETGVIIGSIRCENANIEGKVEGELVVNGLLILKSKAVVLGNITVGKLVVEEGAVFNGNSNMGDKTQIKLKNNAPKELQKEAV